MYNSQLYVKTIKNIYIYNNKFITQNQATTAYNIWITVIVNGHYVHLIDTFIVRISMAMDEHNNPIILTPNCNKQEIIVHFSTGKNSMNH